MSNQKAETSIASPNLDLPVWLETIEETIIAVAFSIIFLVMVLQVFSRYVFNFPFAWTEEVARCLFIWIIFIGASQCMRWREHIAITLLVDRFPKWARIVASLVISALIAAFLVVVMVVGTQLALKVAKLPSTALGWSMALVYAPVPIGAALMLVRLALDLRLTLRGRPASSMPRSL